MSNRAPSMVVSKALNAIGLTRERYYSNIKLDEALVFFNTSAWQDPTGEFWHIPIHGWVYQPQSSWAVRELASRLLKRKYGLTTNARTADTFKQRMDWFTVDDERRKCIIIDVNNQLYELPKSETNGQFQGLIKVPVTDVEPDQHGIVTFNAVLKAKDSRTFNGQVGLISPQGVSIISDIDDTVKVSYINDRKRMFEAAFFQDFVAVKGMPELYCQWQEQGASFHFVSSSPWQLYPSLEAFTRQYQFPWASFALKKVRIKDETFLNLFKSGLVTKPVAIKAILKRYPKRRFVLVGDSSEQDAQVYAQMAREYPNQIAKIFIRNVHADKGLNERYKIVFEGLKRRLWTTFVYPSQITLDVKKLINTR